MAVSQLPVADQLATEHEAHRRAVISAFAWVLAVFPLVAALAGMAVVSVRGLVPLLGLTLVGLAAVLLVRRGRVEAAFVALAAAGVAVLYDAHAVQRVSAYGLAYLPLLVLVAVTAVGRRGTAMATALALAVVVAARWTLFDGFSLAWFAPTLDAAAIVVMSAVVVTVDRRRVDRDRALLRSALLDSEQRRLRETELSRQLGAAARAAAEASDAKTQFLLRVSHELRTPLNAILGYAELLAEDEEFPDAHRRDVDRIDRAGRALLRLVDDVLDLSRIEAGQLELRPTRLELGDLLEPALTLYRSQIAAGRNSLAVEVGPGAATVDVGRTRQVLGQLLSNAARFTHDGTITVRVRRDEARLELEVEDTGIGIARDRIPHLFLPFVQADRDIAYRFGGTGLGLALVDRLVRGMGGWMDVDSEVGVGSRFRVTLPVAELARRTADEAGVPVA